MVSRRMIQTFSYPADKVEIIEKVTKMARQDGISFSEYVFALLEAEARKKVEGSESPINVFYGIPENKPLQTDLTQWIQTVHDSKNDVTMLTRIAKIGHALEITANDYIRRNKRYGPRS